MSRVQLALNVSDLDEAIAFYSKLFATEPNKVRPGYANFAVADPPLKLVLIEGARRAGVAQPPRCRGRDDRRGRSHRRAPARRGAADRDRGRRRLLLRGAGQGVGRRPRRPAVGDLHRARRRRDGTGRAPHRAARRRRALLRRRAGVGRALLLTPRHETRDRRPRTARDRGSASAPRSSSRSSSVPGSTRSGSRPTTSACNCSRTRSRPAPGSWR